MATRSMFTHPCFPPELVLESIQRLHFNDGSSIFTLLKTHPRIRQLLLTYERSVTKHFIRTELPHAPTDFPCDRSEGKRSMGYAWLKQCVKRYDIVDDIMATLVSELNCFAVEKWNMAVVNVGLLLLYRLQSFEAHSAKLEFLKSLPNDPLSAIYMAINHATLTARYHGSGIMLQRTYGRFMDADTLSLRSDIEFSFAEGCLQLGPLFIHSMLLNSASAEPALLNLYHEHRTNDWSVRTSRTGELVPPITQGPKGDPEMLARSLWSVLLERLAEVRGCSIEEVRGRVEGDVDGHRHRLAWLNLCGKARLMRGEDLD